MEKPRLFLLDAYALIYRAHYAFINNPRMTSAGQNTSAIFGFINTVEDIIKKHKPTHFGVVFDPGSPTFRHELFGPYKQNREKTPEDIIFAVPKIKEILGAMHIPAVWAEGYEADDVVGTLAHKAEADGFEVTMVTTDKDYLQLITENVRILRPGRSGKEEEILDEAYVKKTYGIKKPSQFIDILTLWGDTSDNIPGVEGIGEKTASKLIGTYGSVEAIFKNTHRLSGKQKENVIAFMDKAQLIKTLVTIKTDVPLDFAAADYALRPPDLEQLKPLFQELEFNTLYSRMAALSTGPDQNTPELKDNKELLDYQTTKAHYHIAETPRQRRQLAATLLGSQAVCFDTETTSLNVHEARLVALSFSATAGEAWFVPVPEDYEAALEIIADFRPVFENNKLLKIGQNMKYDIEVLYNYDLMVSGPCFDTMIAHYLLEPEGKHNLDHLAERYLNYKKIPTQKLIGPRGDNQLNMRQVDKQLLMTYACEDAEVTFRLWPLLAEELKRHEVISLFEKVEMPLIQVLAQMEYTGIRLDTAELEAQEKELNTKLEEIKHNVLQITGEDFNLSSPKQLGDMLFDKLKIHENLQKAKGFKPKVNKTRRYSTGLEVLKTFAATHPAVEKIIEYKQIEKDESRLDRALELRNEIYMLCGQSFNLNSTKELGEILYEKLKITPNPPFTETLQYSTSEDDLLKLQHEHPIVPLILQNRTIEKLTGTYIRTLPGLVRTSSGRLHTSFNQAVTATGRLSSDNPNLQNIPIRTPEGRRIRKAFVPTNSDYIIASADYSQIELRLMAAFSQDPQLIEAFVQGQDIHTATAAKIFNLSPEDVSRDQRSIAKSANFGIIYGISSFGLSENLGISRKEASDLINNYMNSYPQIAVYKEKQIRQARERGYVTTLLGRRRYLRDINSQNSVMRGYAERNAINAPIQGSAADIIKIAMINIQNLLEAGRCKTKMLLQVHDELVFDLHKAEADELLPKIRYEMEHAVNLVVPLVVESGTGNNWLEAH